MFVFCFYKSKKSVDFFIPLSQTHCLEQYQSTIGAFCGIYRTSNPLVKWLMQSQRYKRQVYQSLQGGNGAIANLNGDDILNMSFPLIEKEKSQSIIFTIEAIEKSLVANKYIHRLYYTQKSYLLKQMFI